MFVLGAGDIQGQVNAGADADEGGVKAHVLQVLQGEIGSPALAEADIDPHPEDGIDLVVQDLLGNLVLGEPVAQRAAKLGRSLEDGDVVPLPGQEKGRCQAGGTAADHGDPLAGGALLGNLEVDLVVHAPVGDKPFQVVDGDRFIDQDPPAARLAEAWADPAHGKGNRVTFHDQPQGLLVLAHGDVGDVALDIDLAGTGQVAGRLAVAKVFLGDEGQPLLAVGDHGLGRGEDLHAVQGQGGAGPEESLGLELGAQTALGMVGDLDNADLAGRITNGSRYVAQGRDRDPGAPGHLEDGQSLFSDDLVAIYGQLYVRHQRYQ